MVAMIIDAKDKKAYDIVKNYWAAQWPGKDKEAAWRKALHDGVIAGVIAGVKKDDPAKVTADAKKVAAAIAAEPKAASNGLEVMFAPSYSTWDGRFANNAWMQEAPDPMTKLTWSNAVMVSPAKARSLSLKDGDVVAISKGSYKLEAAVMIQPGHADESVSIALGYGRTKCGRVGTGVGYNAGSIRTSDGFWFADGFSLTATGKF